jgi:small neutral amino acid transporter SnatA (MarC family)
MAQISAIINMYAGANKALEQGGFLGIAMAASVIASGMANVLNIEKQMTKMSKAATGASFITDGPQMMIVGEQGREQVNVTPLEGPNIAGPQTSPVTINISGNVLSNEFVMDDVIPAIRSAATMNLA